jgi:hypothetical protein
MLAAQPEAFGVFVGGEAHGLALAADLETSHFSGLA